NSIHRPLARIRSCGAGVPPDEAGLECAFESPRLIQRPDVDWPADFGPCSAMMATQALSNSVISFSNACASVRRRASSTALRLVQRLVIWLSPSRVGYARAELGRLTLSGTWV